MIKVAFTSIFYPLFMGRYMLEALLRREDVEVWTCGPYTGRWIPWKGGMNLKPEYLYPPSHPLPAGAPPYQLHFNMIEKQCPFEPDLWINVSSTLKTHGRPKNGKYAVIAADPHVLDYSEERGKADLFFNMQRPYMKPGDIWLPYGYDPIWHAQTTIPASEREIDATLIGLDYPSRNKLVARLRQPNQHKRRANHGFRVYYELGPCYNDAREIYHNSIVGLNWSSLKDTTARVFEIMAFGIVPVLNRVPDLMEMFVDRQDFLGFDTEDEAVALVHTALDDLDWAQDIGNKARLAVEKHSWDARMQKVLESAGLVEPIEPAGPA
jgi:glycosyltransferase involved in cell wall biosynthesis